MKSAVVIGGGLAGLRAGVELSDQGSQVTLLESRTTLGGRARSFLDPASQEVVDNGQHLFLGAYQETIQFLNRLGTAGHLIFQDHLAVTFVEPGGKRRRLECPRLPAPWHLLMGLARLSSLPLRDRMGLGRIAREVRNGSHSAYTYDHGSNGQESGWDKETVNQWLGRMGQSVQARAAFWDPLVIATLNEDPDVASAVGLISVLRAMMQAPWPQARLGMSSVGLSDLYGASAQAEIESKGGTVYLNKPAKGFQVQGSRIQAVELADGQQLEADAVIAALPPAALQRLLPENELTRPLKGTLDQFETSPIISINLWLDRSITDDLFVSLTGTQIQWLFNKQALFAQGRSSVDRQEAGYLSLIISAAHDQIDLPNEALVEIAMKDLKACFPKSESAVVERSQVVREREATVSLGCGMESLRPGPRTAVENLFLAGDWTATGLPATIESAVVSGRMAAEALLNWLASDATPRYN